LRILATYLRSLASRLAFGIATLCLAGQFCAAQRYSFRETTEGLGNLNVNCIAQDRTGYLWVGTENGLYRYDGVQFRRYGVAEGVRGRIIQNLYAGLDGTLWVGTTTGIYFERQDGSFAEVHPPSPVNEFSQRIGTAFAAMAPDQVAMADRSGAFLLRRVGSEQWTAESMHLEGRQIWSVLSGTQGELWYGCDKDLCRYAGGHTNRMGAALGLPEDEWLHLLKAGDGNIWLRGLAHLGAMDPAGSRFELHELEGKANPAPYLSLTQDRQGRIAASEGAAFGLWEKGQWRMVTGRNGLSHHDISALFVDREGSFWAGLIGHGLMRWLGQGRWEAYTTAEGLDNDTVWASLRDANGRLWIGTESGLDEFPAGAESPKKWTSRGIDTSRAISLAESDGVWVGTGAGVLARIDEKKLAGKQWKTPEVYKLLADGNHRLWIATAAGLYEADTLAGDHAPRLVKDAAIAMPIERFTDLCLDGKGRMWAASDRGLYRLDENGWRRIDPGLAGVNPLLIAADAQGNLWATEAAAGIVKLRISGDGVVEAAHLSRPPLLSEQVTSLRVDHRGWLWVGQDAGLSVFDGQTWRSFNQDDGLIWNDIDANGLSEDTDGSMWVGTSGGLSHLINPEAGLTGPPQAPVFSESKLGETAVENEAQIPWSASPLAISMSALSFRDAGHIRFRYRLVGLEPDWVETAEKNVRYPRLAPGNYRFEAEAVDLANGDISPPRSLSFRIAPRWWQIQLLPLGFSLLAGIAVVLTVRWRVQLLQAQKQQLEQAVQRRTDDLEREKTELLNARDQLRHFAEHDGLTGLWNHRIIIDRLRNEIDRAQREGSPIGVILADVDHFKHINDTFGHQAGDHVLKELGEIFVRSVRSYDWVGRYGGEEFLLILPGSGFGPARNRAEQLRITIERTRVQHGNHSIPVTVSFGVASGFPNDYETIIQAADSALYRAKDNGRNCVMAAEVETMEGESWVRGK
jgi:diguanylate cyclase (GGDEF)-like protein